VWWGRWKQLKMASELRSIEPELAQAQRLAFFSTTTTIIALKDGFA